MTRIPSSFFTAPAGSRSAAGAFSRPRGWLLGWALLVVAGALSPAVSAASAEAPASIINATTGQSDAASVVPIAVCPPSTPVRATCAAQILGVRGSGSFVHPRLRRPSSPYRFRRPRARGSHAAAAAVPAAGQPQPGTPAYLQQAYDLAYLSQNAGIDTAGTPTTIAIVAAFDDPTAEADLATYRSEFGLAPCTSAGGCFSEYDQTGGTNYPTATETSWELETSLDLDAVSALCPNCHIDLIEADSDQITDLAAAQATAGSLPGVTVISDSWDVALSGWNAREFASSGQYSFPGITTIAASGDYGYPGAHANDFPAALPDVTAAGGTTLTPASTSGVQSVRAFTEAAWSGDGSGCNLAVTKPTWQTDTGCKGRSVSDVSADADPETGMQVYDTAGGGWVVTGGTSLAAPLIAAYYAVVGSAGQGPSWPYLNQSALNDPSTGTNNSAAGSCTATLSYICNAGPGYDGPTGIGSISGAVAPGAPGIAGPGTNGSYTQSVTANSAQLQGGIYPNGSATSYWWEYGTTTSYGQQTIEADAATGTTPQSVTGSLTGLQPATTYHYRLVALNTVGTEYGYDFTLTTAPSSANSPNQGSPASQPAPTTTTTSAPPVTVTPGSGSTGTATLPTPDITHLRVAAAGATNATITATIATHGAATTYSLSYGPTATLVRRVSSSLAASASQAANVSWNVRNLSPGKIYSLQAVATNAAGSSQSAPIRFRTSPVAITSIAIHGNQLRVTLRCHGSAPCRARLEARSGSRVFAAGLATVRGNRTQTVTLKLTRAFQTLSARRKSAAKLLALSSWNGVTATVSKTL